MTRVAEEAFIFVLIWTKRTRGLKGIWLFSCGSDGFCCCCWDICCSDDSGWWQVGFYISFLPHGSTVSSCCGGNCRNLHFLFDQHMFELYWDTSKLHFCPNVTPEEHFRSPLLSWFQNIWWPAAVFHDVMPLIHNHVSDEKEKFSEGVWNFIKNQEMNWSRKRWSEVQQIIKPLQLWCDEVTTQRRRRRGVMLTWMPISSMCANEKSSDNHSFDLSFQRITRKFKQRSNSWWVKSRSIGDDPAAFNVERFWEDG